MPAPFRPLRIEDFAAEVRAFAWTRRVWRVDMHHTWYPAHADYDGVGTIERMAVYHTRDRGFDDIAQHVSIAPDGLIWTGFVFLGCNTPNGLGGTAGGNQPLPNKGHSGLIGRVDTGPWFWVGDGSAMETNLARGGRLHLRTNDDMPGNGNNCTSQPVQGFRVHIHHEKGVVVACEPAR